VAELADERVDRRRIRAGGRADENSRGAMQRLIRVSSDRQRLEVVGVDELKRREHK
jgi:hypothetical protein